MRFGRKLKSGTANEAQIQTRAGSTLPTLMPEAFGDEVGVRHVTVVAVIGRILAIISPYPAPRHFRALR